MTRICTLQKERAVAAVKDAKEVMYRHGVWNSYEKISTESAIKSIRNSGYGADVSYDDKADMYYVSVPCDADMW